MRFISVHYRLGGIPVIIEGFVENGEVLGVRLLNANDGSPLTWALNNAISSFGLDRNLSLL